jgi:RHS repeat-associated protein
VVSYIYGDDLLSQKRPGTGTGFYHYDGQMSVRQLTDSTGVVTDTYTYDAFGTLLATTGATENRFLYSGEQYDPNIGFYYLRARYYHASAGRFLGQDPFEGNIFEPVTLHRYLYANANPVMYSDPTGRISMLELMEVAAVITVIGMLADVAFVSYSGIQQFFSHADTPVEWQGTLRQFGAGSGLGFTVMSFQGHSECRRNRQGKLVSQSVSASAILAGYDLGVIPLAITRSTGVTMTSAGWLGPSPNAFAGMAFAFGAALVIGMQWLNIIQLVQMGNAATVSPPAGPSTNPSGLTEGVNLGGTWQVGISFPDPFVSQGVSPCPDPN